MGDRPKVKWAGDVSVVAAGVSVSKKKPSLVFVTSGAKVHD